MFGRMLNGTLGRVHFWLMFLAFNSTFFPLFIAGFLGMPRRVVAYPERFEIYNTWASISAFVLGFSMLIFLVNLVFSLVISRTPAPANPWHATSLEWQTTSPPPAHNFDEIPQIEHPHDYGVDEPDVIRRPRPATAEGS
jgi:cytochrome c oxidase subunit I